MVQCFNLEDGTYKRTINTIENNSKIYSIHPAESQLAVIMGPSAQSASKLFLYDINTNEATEAKLSEYEQISNPHDVSMTPNGQNVVVANLNPPQVWLFENQSLINIGRADVVPVKIAESRESPALSKSYDQPPKSPWNVLLLLVVFTTGGTMILYYISKCSYMVSQSKLLKLILKFVRCVCPLLLHSTYSCYLLLGKSKYIIIY